MAAPDVEELLRLQRTAGNRAVAALVGGDATGLPAPPALQRIDRSDVSLHTIAQDDQALIPAKADSPTLASELATLKAKEVAFAKGTGPALDDMEKARRQELGKAMWLRTVADEEETLKGNAGTKGKTSAQWFADVKSFTFLDRSVKVHQLLYDRLMMAEDDFLKAVKVAGEQKPDGGWIKSTSGLREPGQALHSFGLAIDINGGTNPWLVNPSGSSYAGTGELRATSQAVRDVIDRAVLLVLGKTAAEESFGTRPEEPDRNKRAMASYDKLSEASGALARYFKLADPANKADLEDRVSKLGDKDPKKGKVDAWVTTIKADKKALEGAAGGKQWTSPTSGFLDLNRRLVAALTDTSRAGLTWLGDDTVASGRDIMHFDTRAVGPIKQIWKSTDGRFTGLGEG